MTIEKKTPNSAAELRTDVEAKVAAQAVATESLSDQDVRRLYHELQIHQVELEMQNEVLNRTKRDLEATRDSYFDLYDLAPVGYLTLNKDGLIQKANLTAGTMLGLENKSLVNKPIQKIIFRDDIDSYYLQSRSAVEASEDFKLELRFVQSDGSPFWVSLQAALQKDGELWIAFSNIGDRKQAEEAVRQSEALSRAIGESIDYGVWVCAPNGRNTYASESFLKMVGITQEQCSKFGWGDVLHPDDADRTIAAWQECVRTGGKWDIEHRFRGVDGQWHHVLARGVPVKNEQGEVTCWVGINLDIDRLRQSDSQALRKNEKRLSDIYASMSEGLALHELVYDNFGKAVDYLIIDVNPAFESITGQERSTAIGKKASELYGTGEAPYLDRYIEVVSTGEPTSFEVHFIPMNKHFHISVFSPEKGKFATVFQDITERNRAEEALRESENRLRLLAKTMLQGVVHQDVNGKIISMNPAAERILGKSREEFLGNSSIDVEHDTIRENGELFPGLEHPTMVALRTGLPVHSVVMGVFNPKLQEYRWIGIDAVPVFSPGEDRPSEVYSIFGDITERKQAELALQRAHDDLEQRVKARTMELSDMIDYLQSEILERELAEKKLLEETAERLQATETLLEKERMLIQQSRQAAMGEMIGNIAHQWRQPLNTLGLYTQRLGMFYGMPSFNKEFLDSSIAKSMGIIQHMSKTIDDFRDYFKPEKEKTEFYVIEAINSTLSLLEGNFTNPKITIDLVEHDKPVINGYHNEFAQVFLNILNNARDAIIEREIADARVTITICSDGNCAVVTVSDNAGGIPDEVINKVFDPYFTTKGPQVGTGIGLFMSKTIIEKNMGGRLTVRNTDTGAEFRIEMEHGTQN